MTEYPISVVRREEWSRRIAATYMFSAPSEETGEPVLQIVKALLERLHSLPLEDTFTQEVAEYFLTQVLPSICRNIIKSKFFKLQSVLKLANNVLSQSVTLLPRFLHLRLPLMVQLLQIVFCNDEYFYNHNQVLDTYVCYVLQNYPLKEIDCTWTHALKPNDLIDLIKTTINKSKVTWSRGKVVALYPDKLQIQYLNSREQLTVLVPRNSVTIAPYNTKSHLFQWRYNLKKGDLIDCEDDYGGWYGATVHEVYDHTEYRTAKIHFRFNDPRGTKYDEQGHYFGFNDYQEVLDLTSPKIQPFQSILKTRNQDNGKAALEYDDINDMEFEYFQGRRVYALPRKRTYSQFLFKTINQFGHLNGFTILLDYLQSTVDFNSLCILLKALGGISAYLHKSFVIELSERLNKLIDKYLFQESEVCNKDFTKEKSQILFAGIRALYRRIHTIDDIHEYENQKKMKLVEKCLQSQALKKKLQGLNELKDISRSVMHFPSRSKVVREWVKAQHIFQLVYMTNSHVQLIKKSEEFFRYLIKDNILEVTDLERVYKLAQKGDYESRISLYKLLQDVSVSFKKEHVNFLIDTILSSELMLILNEDIDLLQQISRYSSHFPCQKIIKFFQSIIFLQQSDLRDYATKKYAEIVAKSYEMRPIRKEVIHSFLDKLKNESYNINQVCKILKGVFEGIGVGDWGRTDLSRIVVEQRIGQTAVEAIRERKQAQDWVPSTIQIMKMLLFLYKQSEKSKVSLQILSALWGEVQAWAQLKTYFYKWGSQLMECDEVLDQHIAQPQLIQFYKKVFSQSTMIQMQTYQFQLAKHLFIQINRRAKYIHVPTTYMEVEYRRKVGMNHLCLADVPLQLVYCPTNKAIAERAKQFYQKLYNSLSNNAQDTLSLLNRLLQTLQQSHCSHDLQKIQRTLLLLHTLIDESEKKYSAKVQSLMSNERREKIEIRILNEIIFSYEKKKEVVYSVPSNMTLRELRQLFAKEEKMEWQDVKLAGRIVYPDYYNGHTLAELDIKETITVSKKYSTIPYENSIMIGEEMNPLAVRAFSKVFQKYSTDGKMSFEQCNAYTVACLKEPHYRHDDKVKIMFAKIGCTTHATLQQFLQFYKLAAKEKDDVVWFNLRNLGVNYEFLFQSEMKREQRVFPREILAENNDFYDILFELLKEETLCRSSYAMLMRMPVCQRVYRDVLGVGQRDTVSNIDLEKIFCVDKQYRFMYILKIMSILICGEKDYEKKWVEAFLLKGGLDKLSQVIEQLCREFNLLGGIKEQTPQLKISLVDLHILNNCLQLLFCLVFHPYSTSYSYRATLVYENEMPFQQKIDCLVSGSDKFAYEAPQRTPMVWEQHKKQRLTNLLLCTMRNLWEEQRAEHVVRRIQTLLCYLLADETVACEQLIALFGVLLKKAHSSELITSFYVLMLSICFCGPLGCQRHYINQLFKHITTPNITSQYFRLLAVLVARFGVDQQNMTDLPQILLQHILSSKQELTIEGCAELLINFDLRKRIDITSLQIIWHSLFAKDKALCQKEETRNALYSLLVEVCRVNPQLKEELNKLVQTALDEQLPSIKITSCSEFNSRSAMGYLGIKNLGNICYMNSMMQQLFFNRQFRYLVLRIPTLLKEQNIAKKESEQITDRTESEDKQCTRQNNKTQQISQESRDNKDNAQEDKQLTSEQIIALQMIAQTQPQQEEDKSVKVDEDNLLYQTQRMFSYMQLSTRMDYIPTGFCSAYKPFGKPVDVMIQQDVQQFLSMYFDRLQQRMKDSPLRKPIEQFYMGSSTNLFQCYSCRKVKKVEEKFYSLSLEVQNSKSLAESFTRFTLGELITQYKCDFCQQKADVSKHTRISRAPHVLTLHLQRIVFNLDTYINDKITTKHQFPMKLNVYPYTLQFYQKKEDSQGKKNVTLPEEYDYQLTGIICHIGNAEMGHYISYIRTNNEKWLEFNDSLVTYFSASNINVECFGGSSLDDDEFQWEKKQSTSKSAYLLIYEKVKHQQISIEIAQGMKDKVLRELSLEEVISNVQERGESRVSEKDTLLEESVENEKHEDVHASRLSEETKEREEIQQRIMEVEEMKKKKSVDQVEVIKEKVKVSVTPYVPAFLQTQIKKDNAVHFFEKNICSNGFVNFYSQLLTLGIPSTMIKSTRKLVFGLWLKSTGFKKVLSALGTSMEEPEAAQIILQDYQSVVNLLIEHNEAEVRTNILNFLIKMLVTVLKKNAQKAQTIIKHILSLLPTTVTKCWTKFSHYFQFWYEFMKEGPQQLQICRKTEVLKHLIHYYLDKDSPLDLPKRIATIGNTYVNPNFTFLLKSVHYVLKNTKHTPRKDVQDNKQTEQKPAQGVQESTSNAQGISQSKDVYLTQQQCQLAYSPLFIDNMITNNYEMLAGQIVLVICRDNLHASEKVAVVLLKGFSLSTAETIQPYLQVGKAFITLDDCHQTLRMKWVLGKATLNLQKKQLAAPLGVSLQDRIYFFKSSYHYEQGSGLLQPLLQCNRQSETYCLLALQMLLNACKESPAVLSYLEALPAPNYIYNRYISFFQEFVSRCYLSSKSKTMYFFHSPQKKVLSKNVKTLYYSVWQKEKEMESPKAKKLITPCKISVKDNEPYREHSNGHSNMEDKVSNVSYENDAQYMNIKMAKKTKNEKQHLVKEQTGWLADDDDNGVFYEEYITKKSSDESDSKVYYDSNAKEDINTDMQKEAGNGANNFYDNQLDQAASNFNKKLSSQSQNHVVNNKQNQREQSKQQKSSQFQQQQMQIKSIKSQEKNKEKQKEEEQTTKQISLTGEDQEKKKQVVFQEYQQQDNKKGFHQSQQQEYKQTQNYKQYVKLDDNKQQDKNDEEQQRIKSVSNAKIIKQTTMIYQKKVVPSLLRPPQLNKHWQKQQIKQDKTSQVKQKQYHPIQFKYRIVQEVQSGIETLTISYHESELSMILTEPTGYTNVSFSARSPTKNVLQRLNPDVWNSIRISTVKGYYVLNTSNKAVRIQTEDGCVLAKKGVTWVWSEHILALLPGKTSTGWPKWQIYPGPYSKQDGTIEESSDSNSPYDSEEEYPHIAF